MHLTIDQAAEATGVSRDTIRRRLRDGHLPNATRGPATGHRDPPWLIPATDLAAAGLPIRDTDHHPAGPDGSPTLHERLARSEALVAAQHAHIADLQTQLTRLHQILTDLTRPTT